MVRKRTNSTEEKFKMAQKDMEDLEFFIREFTSFLPLAVCTINPLGIIVDTNKAFLDLVGYKPIEITGEHLMIIFLEKEELEKILKIAIGKEFSVNKELTLITKQKEKIPANVAVSSRKDKGGNFIGYFASIINITESKKLREGLEQRVRERTKELQENIDELEKIQKLTVGRELRMIELKGIIRKLEEEKLEKKD